MKIKKGDTIKVLSGKDKGRDGKVDRVYRKQKKVLVPGVNIYKKHIKKNEQMPQGGVVELSRPLLISRVMLICPKCKKPTRVGYRIDGEKKHRICKRCDSIL